VFEARNPFILAHGYFIPVLEKIAWEGEFILRSDP